MDITRYYEIILNYNINKSIYFIKMNIYNLYNIGFGTSIGICIIYIYYPQSLRSKILCELMFYGIKCYSHIQISCNRFVNNNKMIKYVSEQFSELKKKMENEIEIIRDSNVLVRCKTENLLTFNQSLIDFLIYSDYQTYPVNKVICKNIYNFVKKYTVCDFKFHLINIIFSEKEKYEIKLSNGENNYFIVGNIIDKYVVAYLLYKQYRLIVNEDTFEYTMEILDNNIETIHISENESIIFEKSSYKIKKNCITDNNDIPQYIKEEDYNGEKISDNMSFIENNIDSIFSDVKCNNNDNHDNDDDYDYDDDDDYEDEYDKIKKSKFL